MTKELTTKLDQLRHWIREQDSVIVAFSAGVDSTFLAAIAREELGTSALAVTATSPAFPERELDEAVALAKDLGITHRVIRSHEMANPDYANNPTSRCYHCKTELYGLLRNLADGEGYACVVDGTNADDLGDFRPGKKAAAENEVRSPLAELGFTKNEIREASAAMGLKTADKPAFACLASRFPYGIRITEEKLRMVERAEEALRELGFRQLRVRVNGDAARVEFDAEGLAKAEDDGLKDRVINAVTSCGFTDAVIDPKGYRQGSLNEALKQPS